MIISLVSSVAGLRFLKDIGPGNVFARQKQLSVSSSAM